MNNLESACLNLLILSIIVCHYPYISSVRSHCQWQQYKRTISGENAIGNTHIQSEHSYYHDRFGENLINSVQCTSAMVILASKIDKLN